MSTSTPSPVSLSPQRPQSRPSSRNSARSQRIHSPSVSLDDPVAMRQQMSTLKHSIRHQQAQLHNLENVVLSGPRPLPPDLLSPPMQVSLSSDSSLSASPSPKMQRRSSREVLQEMAGSDSHLPLPKMNSRQDLSIQEGVPTDFGSRGNSASHSRRESDSLSRIPMSSVGNARVLAENNGLNTSSTSSSNLGASTSSLGPPSPNRRASYTPAATTKVLADLQAGVSNARTALENTKGQLRQSQRTVAILTQQTEKLKEGKESLRLEVEQLKGQMVRKERMLSEAVERARKAEAQVGVLTSQRKEETATTSKSLRAMEAALTESTALSSKSEREYLTLRDSLKGMAKSWTSDTELLKAEMLQRETKWRKEAEEVGKKYTRLLQEVKSREEGGLDADRQSVKALMAEDAKVRKELEVEFKREVEGMKVAVEQSNAEGAEAAQIAKNLAEELAHLRRLMRLGATADSKP